MKPNLKIGDRVKIEVKNITTIGRIIGFPKEKNLEIFGFTLLVETSTYKKLKPNSEIDYFIRTDDNCITIL